MPPDPHIFGQACACTSTSNRSPKTQLISNRMTYSRHTKTFMPLTESLSERPEYGLIYFRNFISAANFRAYSFHALSLSETALVILFVLDSRSLVLDRAWGSPLPNSEDFLFQIQVMISVVLTTNDARHLIIAENWMKKNSEGQRQVKLSACLNVTDAFVGSVDYSTEQLTILSTGVLPSLSNTSLLISDNTPNSCEWDMVSRLSIGDMSLDNVGYSFESDPNTPLSPFFKAPSQQMSTGATTNDSPIEEDREPMWK